MPFIDTCRGEGSRWEKPLHRRLGLSLLVNTGLALGLLALFSMFEPLGTLRHFLVRLIIFQLYTHCTGDLAVLVLPPMAIRLSRISGWKKWIPYVAVLIAVGLAGSALAASAVFALGLGGGDTYWEFFSSGAKIGVLITLMMGAAAHTIETLKARVQATTLQLRTHQLERERALKLAAEARFESLQSRLQPHFLFNTINSILALLREDAPRAEEMLERLARLLRFALDSQQAPVVRLSEELRLVTDYLEIEHARFGDRLRFTIDSPAELGPVEIPAYALQTLVENCMKHAIAPRRDGGAIRVRVAREDDSLVAEVSDDGPGFSGDALRAGHGLDMLEQRLEALYGAEASIEIAAPPTGACVWFRLPMTATV
ncbi:MAG: histidine kinase [Bryobacteraceae bacterium]|jgi:two-component sensor histidine kinase